MNRYPLAPLRRYQLTPLWMHRLIWRHTKTRRWIPLGVGSLTITTCSCGVKR